MDEVPRPEYARDDVTTGVVHFGVGGFHRAHMAMYHDRLMNEARRSTGASAASA
jgi:mannitol 2-dehydrogenase